MERIHASLYLGSVKTLAENVILAEKPHVFLADRYLPFTRHTLFEL